MQYRPQLHLHLSDTGSVSSKAFVAAKGLREVVHTHSGSDNSSHSHQRASLMIQERALPAGHQIVQKHASNDTVHLGWIKNAYGDLQDCIDRAAGKECRGFHFCKASLNFGWHPAVAR
ncbi:hypothetical protein WJX79_002710 [Trebouxia sp. C0005]